MPTEPITDVVDIEISLASVPIQGEAFGTTFILGDSNRIAPDLIRFYNSLTAVGSDFQPGDPEYLAAQSYFSQSPTPVQVAIGAKSANVAQVATLTINNAVNGHTYVAVLDGFQASYTANNVDTTATIAEALENALDAVIAASNEAGFFTIGEAVGAVITITALFPGNPFTLDNGADINSTVLVTVVNVGPVEALMAILNAGHTSDWYGLVVADHGMTLGVRNGNILALAPFVEALKPRHVFYAQTGDANVLTASSIPTNFLFAKTFLRSPWIYSGNLIAYPAASIAALFSATQPGAIDGQLKTLPGVTPDLLTPTQINNIVAKNGNRYVQFQSNGTFNALIDGRCPNAQWIDNLVGTDFIANSMTIGVLNYLRSQAKVPYTDDGISAVANIVKQWLSTGVDILLFTNDPRPTITQTPASNVSANLKAARKIDNTVLTFAAELANAINSVFVTGKVSF